MSKNRVFHLLSGLVTLALIISACAAPATEAPTAAPNTGATQAAISLTETAAAPPPTAEPEPPTATPEPTAVPLGTADRPITMAIAPSATTDELIASGNTIAELLSKETGLTIQPVVPTNYKAMIEAMCSGNAQVGWLPPFAYLIAHETKATDASGAEVACADVAFITLRNGEDHYATQYVARAADGYVAAKDETDLAALTQFEGKKPCWTDQFSASGYVIPASLLAQVGVKFRTAAFVQGHPTVVRAVYAGGICDFGATFVDARTNSAVQTDLPDVNEKVIVVYQTPNIIPNDTVGFAYDLPAELREQITAALDKISQTEDGAAAMRQLYSIDGLKATDDTFFDEFRVLLAASGIDIASLVR
ncbi:MAG TPA: phosphate/phosphite/phosphonate ABC transporter substrate-binding protein [Anaerolineales bacterium]|nr:phosphate/phosphite/phosphonate ABC transporter substrate-binding protein [Anaerolineales bacterium]